MDAYTEWADGDEHMEEIADAPVEDPELNRQLREQSAQRAPRERPQSVIVFNVEESSLIQSSNAKPSKVAGVRSKIAAGERPRSQFFPEFELQPMALQQSDSTTLIMENGSDAKRASMLGVMGRRKSLLDIKEPVVPRRETVTKFVVLSAVLFVVSITMLAFGIGCISSTCKDSSDDECTTTNFLPPSVCHPIMGGGSVSLLVIGTILLAIAFYNIKNIVQPKSYLGKSMASTSRVSSTAQSI